MDRLSVSFPVENFDTDPSVWDSVTVQNPGTPTEAERRNGHVQVAGTKAFVGVSYIPSTGRWWGKIELNPSRILDPDGWGTAPAAAVPGVAHHAFREVAEVMKPALASPDEANLKRLDVARDFSTDHGSYLVRGLGPVHRPWARRNLLHFDPSRGGAQTLMVGSGAGVVRLYDKHAETEGKAPEGTLRWEVEARSAWAKQYGELARLGDLKDTAKVERLAHERWDWSQMGAEVSGTEATIDKVQRLGLSPTKERGLVGWLVMRAYGIDSPLATDTASLYRRLAREHGLAMNRDELDGLVRIRLDWDTGQEVRTNAQAA